MAHPGHMIMKLKVNKPDTRVQSFEPGMTSQIKDKNQNTQGKNNLAEKETSGAKEIFQSLL